MPTLSKEINNFGRKMHILTSDNGERIRVGIRKPLQDIINEASTKLGITHEEAKEKYLREGNLSW